jgi:striatin 1/3/4
MIAVTNSNWRQGRQLLRQYLQEIGYTDTIIDVRSNRVRSLLGLQADQENDTNQNLANGAETTRRVPDNRRRPAGGQTSLAEEMLINTEESVMANFDFLAREDDIEDEDEPMGDETDDGFSPAQIVKKADLSGLGVDTDTEDVLKEFNFLTQPGQEDAVAPGAEWSGGGEWGVAREAGGGPGAGPAEAGASLELGELEQLTISNDNDLAYDQITTPKEAFRKTWSAKYTLRSHFDGVRSLGFHPSEPVLITASEDQTLKMWNLQKTITTKKSTNLDVEPVYTFRGHTGPVLCLCVSGAGDFCFSGGVDGSVRCWQIPPPTIDPYDTYDASVSTMVLEGHSDSVWSLAYSVARTQLISCSADGSVKLWSPGNTKAPLVATLGEAEEGVPTACDWVTGEVSSGGGWYMCLQPQFAC